MLWVVLSVRGSEKSWGILDAGSPHSDAALSPAGDPIIGPIYFVIS
jgi:hypothetical protein